MNKTRFVVVVAAAALFGCATTVATAQPNWQATPVYATVNLSAGFTPDPWMQPLQAGGSNAISSSVNGCSGYINFAAPDVDLNYRAGSLPLFFRVESNSDTTLAVLDPAGNWYCNDDAVGLDPMIRLDNPRSGNYNIWVGTYSSGTLRPANLLITELSSVAGRQSGGGASGGGGGGGGGGNVPNWRANPLFGSVNLNAGFTPDPFRRDLQAGGNTDVSNMINGCRGFINAGAPDVDLYYQAGSLPLHIRAASGSDTTLVVRAPDGQWYCNDDRVGLDPLVSFGNPQSGMYNIWVGIYGSGRTAPAQLRITELNSVAESR